MIITQIFDLFLFLIKKMTVGDFARTFSYFAFLALTFNALKALLYVD